MISFESPRFKEYCFSPYISDSVPIVIRFISTVQTPITGKEVENYLFIGIIIGK